MGATRLAQPSRPDGPDQPLAHAALAQSPAPTAPAPAAGTSAGARFNAEFLSTERSERIFAFHLQRLGIRHMLDIGSNCGQFAQKLRRHGYQGLIYSVEPQASAYAQLLSNSRGDLRWFPLARQAAGASGHFTDLNLSQNGWSSSFREVHPNHLGADAGTRVVGTERVFVNRSSKLLRAAAMADVQALKIDVQGFEDQVIEGYLPLLANVRLLLLEMSLVECYRGSPDLFALDARLVKELGFSRVSLEPSYYDDVLGVVQQYDGIYYRPEPVSAASARPSGARLAALVTSVGGKLERRQPDGTDLGPVWLQMCLDSWQQARCPLVSVSEQAPPNGLQWVKTESRPSIAQMLAAITPPPGSHLLLVNADIVLLPAFFDMLAHLEPDAVYYGSRTDVERTANARQGLQSKGIYELGFDYFLLPAEFLELLLRQSLLPHELRIGEPWWDYALPLLAIAKGFALKRLPWNAPLALHYDHPARYSQDIYQRNAAIFRRMAERLLREPDCHATSLLTEILAAPRRTASIICAGLP